MAVIFNTTSSGSFTTPATFTKPLSTAGAVITGGTSLVRIGLQNDMPTLLSTDSTPVLGVFLNIAKVDPYATGTFTITLKDFNSAYTYTYDVSSLFAGSTTGMRHSVSQYWQGFTFNGVDLSADPTLTVSLSCSIPGEVIAVGNTRGDVNRFFIPATLSDYFSAFCSATAIPDIFIGSYLNTNDSGFATTNTSITCNYPTFIASSIKICNNSTLELTNTNTSIITEFLVSPGSQLIIHPNSIINLNFSGIISLDNSLISAVGSPKTPYTFLDTDIGINDISCNVIGDISTWSANDTLLFANNTAANTFETIIVNSINTNTINLLSAAQFEHYSYHNSNVDLFKDGFKGAPVSNLTRDIIIQGPGGFIRSEAGSTLHLTDVNFLHLSQPVSSSFGSINIYNDATTITGCNILSSAFVGIYIQSQSATNFNIGYNTIHHCDSYGIIIDSKSPIVYLIQSNIYSNVILNAKAGLVATFYSNININDNIIASNTTHGLMLNESNDFSPSLGICSINSISGNKIFNNGSIGALIRSSNGFIVDTTTQHNKAAGMMCTSNDYNIAVGVSGVKTACNVEGLVCSPGAGADICRVSVCDITAINNTSVGMRLNSVFGEVSTAQITGNDNYGVDIQSCNKDALNLTNFTVNDNTKSIFYDSSINFYPFCLKDSNIKDNFDGTCIVLNNTKCEKFSVNNTNFNSTGPNITLIPTNTSLIEGSYLFSQCTFSNIPFDDIKTKYQSNVLDETGFSSMYENNNQYEHHRITTAGRIDSDTTVYKNPLYPFSEKLTPWSDSIRLKSSKKVIFLDNFDSNVPPNLEPEYLYVSVWIKKDANWGNNDAPRLMVAANPTLGIYNDTEISAAFSNTTDWFQLISIEPCASAINTRGSVEMYVDCLGTSGGSVNIDSWEQTIVRNI